MTAVTIDVTLLKTAEKKADWIWGQVDRCRVATAALVCSFVIFPPLYRLNRIFLNLKKDIGSLKIESDDEIEWAYETAKYLAGFVRKLDDANQKYEILNKKVWPWVNILGPANLRLFDDVACSMEDIAETLALVSNSAFMEMLDRDLSIVDGQT